jgi:hypothetical protein
LTLSLINDFFAYDPAFRGGVRVGSVHLSYRDDIVTAPGPSGGSLVKNINGLTSAVDLAFNAFDPAFQGGISVGGTG